VAIEEFLLIQACSLFLSLSRKRLAWTQLERPTVNYRGLRMRAKAATMVGPGLADFNGRGELIARRPVDFRWTRVFHALTILLVQFKAWPQKGEPGEFVMEGRKGSPAAALAGGCAKR